MVTWVYILTMLVSVGVCSLLLRKFQHSLAIKPGQKIAIWIAAFAGAMIGAKLPFLLSDLFRAKAGAADGWSFFSAWFANGKTIMFGIVGGYFSVELVKKALRIRVRTGDSFAIPVAIGVALGRLACFAAGCCHGTPTELPWGVHFSLIDSDPDIFRHPTQIYEFLFHSIAAVMLFAGYRRLYKEERKIPGGFDLVFWGNLIKAYILAYLIYRLFSEVIRPEPEIVLGLTVYQIAAILLIPIFGAVWGVDIFNRWQRLSSRSTH